MQSMQRSWQQGEHYVWASGAAVGLTLLMVAVLIGVILVNGLGFYWPSDLAQAQLADGSKALGEITGSEVVPGHTQRNLQFKVGNRQMYGQDFRWIAGDQVQSVTYPDDAVMLERVEYGNFYGYLDALKLNGLDVPEQDAPWERLRTALAVLAPLHAEVDAGRLAVADLSRSMEELRLQIQELRYEGAAANAAAINSAQAQKDQLGLRFERRNNEVTARIAELRRNTAVFRDANGQTKEIALLDIVRAVQPNRMGLFAKAGFYAGKLRELLLEQPRESNTEGGLFPAIFGTVMLVLIMSMLALPLGVITAIYLREYAREGLLVRLVRIAVYNLAGVPSIVFGVFGLGFFVYGVGAGIDALFFPERLPQPTFGTGGILWASLTLGLLTVPVVIVATEEGLTAIPRGLREASLALGATRFQTLVRVVMPMALPGILTGFILAVARAAGEVAPLMLTGVVKLAPALPIDGHFPYVHLERKFMHLGFHIYDVGFQSPNVEAAKPMVYITTTLLVLIVIVLSLTAIYMRNVMRKRFQTSTF